MINPEAQRMLDRSFHYFPRNAFRPIAIREESVDHVQIEPGAICTDHKLAGLLREFHPRNSNCLKPRRTRSNTKEFNCVSSCLVSFVVIAFQNADRRNETSCHPSMYLYGVSPVV